VAGDERLDLEMIGFYASKLERLPALADGKPAPDDAEDEVPELPEDIVLDPSAARARR
jgi:hypothetical protein